MFLLTLRKMAMQIALFCLGVSIIASCLLILSGCSGQLAGNKAVTVSEAHDSPHSIPETSDKAVGNELKKTRLLTKNGRIFHIVLENNVTVTALVEHLPLKLTLSDLHQKEKYGYLSQELPTEPHQIERIEKGDVLLFGSDCFVLFYKSFETTYFYTRIGKIRETEVLDFLIAVDAVEIFFE